MLLNPGFSYHRRAAPQVYVNSTPAPFKIRALHPPVSLLQQGLLVSLQDGV